MTQDPFYPPGVTRPPAYDPEDEPMCQPIEDAFDFDDDGEEDICDECGGYLSECTCDD